MSFSTILIHHIVISLSALLVIVGLGAPIAITIETRKWYWLLLELITCPMCLAVAAYGIYNFVM